MSTVYADMYTDAVQTPVAPVSYQTTEYRSKLRVISGTYEAASLASGSTIACGVLKKGEMFVDGWVMCDDLSSAGTLAVGDAGDADRYLAPTVFTTANQKTWCNAEAGFNYVATVDRTITITTAVEEMTGTIKFAFFIATME